MSSTGRHLSIFLVSDGTGDTGGRFLEAALLQFEEGSGTGVRKFAHVRSQADVDRVIEEARQNKPLVLHTLVNESLRQYFSELCRQDGLEELDMLGSLFAVLSKFFQAPPKGASGVLHEVNSRYFQRIEAIEFTLRHDDGRVSRELPKADIILLGVSRTSKTPTSVFLAQKGYKVVNVPIVKDVALPDTLFTVDQKKIVGLTINPLRLQEIRRIRMQRMGAFEGDYADIKAITSEVEYAEQLFKRNRQWPVIDVTDRAIEETADQILNVMFGRERKLFG